MGWGSATRIFDQVVEALLDENADKRAAILALAEVLEEGDWDCQRDSEYWDHPLVKEVFQELGHDYDEEG